MAEMHKRVASVAPVPLGDETAADHSLGDTVILVANSGDFYEDGGHVRIDGEVYAYVSVEEGEDDDAPPPSITLLAPGLLADVDEGTAVEAWDPKANDGAGDVVVDWLAEVTDDTDGSPGIAYLSHGLIPLVSEGLPAGVGDSVTVTMNELGDWVVTDIHGRTATLDGSYIDPTTLPDPVPIEAPTSSPTLFATGLPDSIVLRTTEPIAATTFLTYQASTDGSTWDDLNDEPIRSEIFVAKTLPDGTDLVDGVTYYFRTIAGNAAGDAAASAATEGDLDTTAVALVAAQLITEEVIAGFGLLGALHIGGDTFTLTPPGVDPDNLAGGLRIQLSNGGLIHLPADGSPGVFSGAVVADYLETITGARLGGEVGVFGNVTMSASDIPDPTVAPTVLTNYNDEQLPVSSPRGLAAGLGGADWATTSNNSQLVTITGGEVTATKAFVGNPVSVTSVGGSYFVLIHAQQTLSVNKLSSALVSQDFETVATAPTGERFVTPRAVIGNDGTNLVIAHETREVDGGFTGDVVITRINPSDWSTVGTITVPSSGGQLGGVYYGDGDGAFAAARWVVQPRDSDVEVYNTSGVRQSSEEWPRPYNKSVQGLSSSALPDFLLVDSAGVVRTIDSTVAGSTEFWSYSWVDSDTHSTLCSPEAEHTRPRGARVKVVCSPAPQRDAAGTHIANRIKIFAATSSGGTKNLQSLLPAGSRSAPFGGIDTGSGGAPGSNNWSGISPTGTFAAESGGFTIDGESDGSIGTGTFRNSVDARVTALASPIRDNLEAVTAATYTLDLADEHKYIQVTRTSPDTCTVTIPTEASVAFPTGAVVYIRQLGTGAVTIQGDTGVTLQSVLRSGSGAAGAHAVSARFGTVKLHKRLTNTWVASENIA